MPPRSPPTCWPGAEPSRSILLVHEVEVLAIPEPGVDRSARERPPLGLLARFAALDDLLQPPAGFFVVQQIRPAFLNDLADDLGPDLPVLQGIQRQHGVTFGHEASRPTAVLGRARTVAPDAARVGLAWLGRQMVLDPDLVPPRNVQVVLVGKPGALAQPQRRQRHLGRGCRQLPRAIAHGTQTELIKVDAPTPSRPGSHRATHATCRCSAPARAATPSG